MSAKYLSFDTESLPSAFLGLNYAATLVASGGLPPYHWTLLDGSPAWLSLDESTGILLARGLDLVAGGYELRVVLRDQSNAGDGHTVERTFSLRVDTCRNGLPCWTAEGIACMLGVQDCVDGVLHGCVAYDPPVFSEDLNRCGSNCRGCDENQANLCVDGRCRCGANEACAVGNVCCGETTGALCVDSTSLAHCGGCDNHCGLRVLNAEGAACTNEQCDYELCLEGWYDCDNDRSNGCEQEQNVEHCAGCDNNCLTLPNVASATCDIEGHQCIIQCMPNWGACLPDDLGCETALDSLAHCGDCGNACAGTICDYGADGYFCGCALTQNLGESSPDNPDGNPSCHANEICCTGDDGRGACIPHSEEHCFDCEDACMPSTGGPHCNTGVPQERWGCECDGDDENCKDYVFSLATCDPISNRCVCEDATTACASTETCCSSASGGPECFNLSNDPNNCGFCQSACLNGDECTAGACECMGGSCPSQAGSLLCVNNLCVCEEYNLQPCPIGTYCWDQGCCKSGGGNDCCGRENVWCSDGSCRQPQDCP